MSNIRALTASANGRLLLLGSYDGLRGYHLNAAKSPKRLCLTTGGSSTRQPCAAVGGPVGVVTVLGETPLVAFVLCDDDDVAGNAGFTRVGGEGETRGTATPRVVHLYDISSGQTLAELHFETAVVGVRMNSRLLVAILEDCVHVFELATLQEVAKLHTLKPRNPEGLLELSEPTTNPRGEVVSYLAYPQSDNGLGDVWVSQASGERLNSSLKPDAASQGNRGISVEQLAIVRAHRCSIACLSITRNGTRLATASTRGTTVKVFEVPSARLLFVFRRGMTVARIHSLAFDPTGRSHGLCIAALSSRGTLHVFRCGNDDCDELPGRQLWSNAATNIGTEMRSFAQASVGEGSALPHVTQAFAMGGGLSKWCSLQSCFFSEDGRFVWVVVPRALGAPPPDVKLRDKLSGASGCASGRTLEEGGTADGFCWVLQLYVVNSRSCELVKCYTLS